MSRRLLRGLAVVALMLGASPASAADVVIFAAASLKDALDTQARSFETATGNRVVVSYGASNALARQVEAGAPADLFVSADVDWMDYVDAKRLVAPGTRIDLLGNALVLVAPATSTVSLRIAPGFGLAAALGPGKLAMANPDSVPAGKYAKAALQHLGAWTGVEPKVARAENVRAALALVSRGEAPLGIVYATDAMADRRVRVVDTFPAESHSPIVYPAAILTRSTSSAARPLLDYLRSDDARATWRRFGFEPAW